MRLLFAILPLVMLASVAAAEGLRDEFQRSLPVEGAVHLDVRSDSGSISIRPGTSNRVEVLGRIHLRTNRRLSASEAQALMARIKSAPPVEQRGNTVLIGHSEEYARAPGLSISYEILTPPRSSAKSHSDSGSQNIEGIDGPLEARADSGGLKIAAIGSAVTARTDSGSQQLSGIDGVVIAAADSGSIKLSDIGGSAKARTDSGGIQADGVDGDFEGHADSGSIRATNVAGGMKAETDSGSIRLEQAAGGDVHASADSGSVGIVLAPQSGYDFSLKASSGLVRVKAAGAEIAQQKRNHAMGKIRGGGYQLMASTDSGSIGVE